MTKKNAGSNKKGENMKVYIVSDLEGASGIIQEAQTFPNGDRYHEGRIALTRDINAAVLGAQDAGANEIVVHDGHARAYNLVYEELSDGAKYYFGGPRTTYSEGLDETFWSRTDVEMPDERTVIFRRDNVLDAANALMNFHWAPRSK